MSLSGAMIPCTPDVSEAAGMVPANGCAGQRHIDVVTNKKSQTGHFRATFNVASGTGKVTLSFPSGIFTTGTNSWEPLPNSFFARALLYNSVTGVSIPVTFQGKRTAEVSWGWIDADPIYLSAIAAASRDWYIYCDTYVTTVGDSLPRNRIANAQQGEGVSNHATNILDYTTKTTRASFAGDIGNNTSVGYCPFIKVEPAPSVKVVVIYGDSRADCLSDSCALSSQGWENSTWYDQAAASTGASVSMIAASGSRLYLEIANGFTLMQKQFAYCRSIGATDFVCMSYANDILNGRTAAQVLADLLTLKAEVERQGMRFWVCTSPPVNATSTDLFLTTTNQTINNATIEGYRVTINTAIRADNTYGYKIEIANALESAQDSGKYKAAVVDPSGPYTCDSSGGAATNVNLTTGGGAAYGRWRNDLIVWATGANTGAAGNRIITNSYYDIGSSGKTRIDWSSNLTIAAADTFNRYQRYTDGTAAAGSGLHWRTEIAQTAAAAALVASGVLS
jgi:hypothetical protein